MTQDKKPPHRLLRQPPNGLGEQITHFPSSSNNFRSLVHTQWGQKVLSPPPRAVCYQSSAGGKVKRSKLAVGKFSLSSPPSAEDAENKFSMALCMFRERPRKSWRCNSTRSRVTINILSPAGVEVSQDKTSARSRHLLNIFSLRQRARRKLVCRCLRRKSAEAGARAAPHESPRLALTHRHRFSLMDFTTKITMLIPFPTAPRAS